MRIHQDPPCGSNRTNHIYPLKPIILIHQDPHLDLHGATSRIHQNPPCRSTRNHPDPPLGPPGSPTGIHQNIHKWDNSGTTKWIHQELTHGWTMWIHQDPPCESTRIHHVDQPGFIMQGSNFGYYDHRALHPAEALATLMLQKLFVCTLPSQHLTVLFRIHKHPPVGSIRINQDSRP